MEDGRPTRRPWRASAHLCMGCQELDSKRSDPKLAAGIPGVSIRLVRCHTDDPPEPLRR